MVLVSVAAVVVAALAVFSATRPPAASGALIPPTTVYSADLTEGASLGSTRAPVVIQLYADFQCPACKQFVVQQLPRLVSDFVRPGTVRIEAEDIDILGSGAVNESVELAAGAYCAAEQNRYWQYHDLVFWNQGRENRGDHDVAFIERVASQANHSGESGTRASRPWVGHKARYLPSAPYSMRGSARERERGPTGAAGAVGGAGS